jgi:hypothetical protein
MESASACVSCNTHLVDQARHEDVYGVILLISRLAWQTSNVVTHVRFPSDVSTLAILHEPCLVKCAFRRLALCRHLASLSYSAPSNTLLSTSLHIYPQLTPEPTLVAAHSPVRGLHT